MSGLIDCFPNCSTFLERDMCRALLEVEWVFDNEWEDYKCPRCGAMRDIVHDVFPGEEHDPCPIDKALTKAGLPDQLSRDEARKRINEDK